MAKRKSRAESDAEWMRNYEDMKAIGIKNITKGHRLYDWMLKQRAMYRKYMRDEAKKKAEALAAKPKAKRVAK